MGSLKLSQETGTSGAINWSKRRDTHYLFDFVSRFSGFLQSLEINNYYSILVVGDFNFPNIQWVEGSGFAYSSSGEEASFTSLLMDYYLFLLVEHPTRGNNILDLVITNTPTFITAGPMTGPQWSDTGVPSDHFPVIFDLSVDVRLKGNIRSKRYDFKHANFESLKQTLLLIPLSNSIDNLNSQEDFDPFGTLGTILFLLP